MTPAFRVSRYFFLLALIWMIGMTGRIYPQFGNAVRVDGRLTTIGEYVADTCRDRASAEASTCLAHAQKTAQRLLHREQGKSILLIAAPLLGYLLIYAPLRLMIERHGRRRGDGIPEAAPDFRGAG